MGKNDWAIVVGVQTYPGLSNLSGPNKDAKEFYDWVVKPEAQGGAGVPKNQAKLITSDKFGKSFPSPQKARPAAEELEAELIALDDWAEANEKAGNGRGSYLLQSPSMNAKRVLEVRGVGGQDEQF